MSTRRERAARRNRPFFSVCPNCGGKGPHFIPPSFGDPGFYACEAEGGAGAVPAAIRPLTLLRRPNRLEKGC